MCWIRKCIRMSFLCEENLNMAHALWKGMFWTVLCPSRSPVGHVIGRRSCAEFDEQPSSFSIKKRLGLAGRHGCTAIPSRDDIHWEEPLYHKVTPFLGQLSLHCCWITSIISVACKKKKTAFLSTCLPAFLSLEIESCCRAQVTLNSFPMLTLQVCSTHIAKHSFLAHLSRGQAASAKL